MWKPNLRQMFAEDRAGKTGGAGGAGGSEQSGAEGSGIGRGETAADSSTDELQAALKAIWKRRTDRYSEEREQRQGDIRQPAEMAYLGG